MTLPLSVLNLQPTEKPDLRPDGSLDVIEVFPTIQGEGPFAGRPAVFVRLAGCNLKCSLCDTQYTEGRQRFSVIELVRSVRTNAVTGGKSAQLVVLTGGEPFRQDIMPLVEALGRAGFQVQVETNGSLPASRPLPAGCVVVCSPKTPRLNHSLEQRIDHYKYVLEAGAVDPVDGLPTSVLGEAVRPARPPQGFVGGIFLQPVDAGDAETNRRNTDAVVQSCLKYGYRLCLQMHKIARLP